MKKKSGFTLIEIMLVVIILGVLAAMVVPRLTGRSDEARRSVAKTDIESNLALALDLFETDNLHHQKPDPPDKTAHKGDQAPELGSL